MRLEHDFVCTLANGLHARPASLIAERAAGFTSEILVIRRVVPEPASVDARSVLSIIGLDVRQGDRCTIIADGTDAHEALEALRDVVENRLDAAEDAAEVQAAAVATTLRVPMTLRHLGADIHPGETVAGGVGVGRVVHVGGLVLPPEAASAVATSVENELLRARHAIASLRTDLAARAASGRTRAEAAVLSAHVQIVADPALWDAVRRAIEHGATAAQGVVRASEDLAATLRAAATEYVRERAIDVHDVATQLLERLLPNAVASTPSLTCDSVVLAESLTPNQLLRLDRAHLKGLVLGNVGRTSHTAILARGFGIPCVIAVTNPMGLAREGERAIVDGDGSFVVAPATDQIAAFYARRERAAVRRRARLAPTSQAVTATRDGQRLEVGVNASSAMDVESGTHNGADGVGLFRTEFLFLERDQPPSEDEQLAVYRDVLRAACGRPVIFRTFDIGGDKPAPYLRIPAEDNPFLGARGLRLYERFGTLLDVQLRAMLRAAAEAPEGAAKIMAPMVATASEAAWFRDRVHRVAQRLREEGHALHNRVSLGVMIEIPSAAMSVDLLAPHVDFFSLGTNDLCQYWMAADRGNRGVAGLNDAHQPSFLRLLRQVVRDARAAGKWIGICGEMGGRVADVPLLVGLGVDEISGPSGNVVAIKQAIASADATRCRALLDAACACCDVPAVNAVLAGMPWRAEFGDRAVVDAECIDVASDATTKAEAIAQAVDLLWIAGRTQSPRDVDAAVWTREETYSTGLGHGFAIPHCKSEAVLAASLVVLRLQTPIEWGSMDGEPVRTVLLLAVPGQGGDAAARHMKIFATLARRLMHEEFRERLAVLADPPAIEAFLKAELGLA